MPRKPRGKWGEWYFKGDTFVLMHGPYQYEFDFDRCRDSAGILDQIIQESRAEIVLKLLGKRFGPPADDVVERVRTAPIERLDEWAIRVLSAESLRDVFTAD